MAKPLPTHEYDAVLAALAHWPGGAKIEQIEATLATPPTRRTLQRWLADLTRQARLHTVGKGRATRYVCSEPLTTPSLATRPEPPAPAEILIPLSAESTSIAAYLRQPWQQRTPVGYQLAFLDRYRPNVSFYLSAAIRAELLACGQAVQTSAPAGTYARQIAGRLLIDLSWNSSRLEGNTYSLLETERLLSVGEAATGKNAQEGQMILNHKEAIEFLITSAADIGFNRYTLLNLHALLSDNLLEDPMASGRLRRMVCPLSFVDVSQPTYISAMLGVYELNQVALLRDVFVWAYKRSCARYSAVQQSLGEPDPFRIRYRVLIAETVAAAVRSRLNKARAVDWVRQCALQQVPGEDRARFIEVCETQLMSLHEGNMARYRLRPSEFQAWREVWA